MNYTDLAKAIQAFFSDGLVIVAGSGLSAAEGIPGMPALASHLTGQAPSLSGADKLQWELITDSLSAGLGLESALQKYPPSESLDSWITSATSAFLVPKEREVMTAVIQGKQTLRLTKLILNSIKQTNGLPIVTTNYDRLIELACEMAELHVDTTAIGQYAGAFDHERSLLGGCRSVRMRHKFVYLDYHPRAIVLKPHGSFDWYKCGLEPRRCTLDLDAERLIITPGVNKYRAGYNSPFDKHRDLANDYIKRAGRLLIIGYGFNDDHLQTHIVSQIKSGLETLILNRSGNAAIEELVSQSPRCLLLSAPAVGPGVLARNRDELFEHAGPEIWDLGVLTEELLT